MGSKYPPRFYDEETLAALGQAYREVWNNVMEDSPYSDFGEEERLRQSIVQTMMELAAEGVSNVDELRASTLAKLSQKPQSRLSR